MSSSKDVAVESDLAIRRLIARYCQLMDDGDLDAAVELFCDDGRFVVLDQDLRGRHAIKGFLASAGGGLCHQVTNVVVSNASQPDIYHALSDVSAMAKTDNGWSTVFVGRYHDTMVGSGRDMRFSQRLLTSR